MTLKEGSEFFLPSLFFATFGVARRPFFSFISSKKILLRGRPSSTSSPDSCRKKIVRGPAFQASWVVRGLPAAWLAVYVWLDGLWVGGERRRGKTSFPLVYVPNSKGAHFRIFFFFFIHRPFRLSPPSNTCQMKIFPRDPFRSENESPGLMVAVRIERRTRLRASNWRDL